MADPQPTPSSNLPSRRDWQIGAGIALLGVGLLWVFLVTVRPTANQTAKPSTATVATLPEDVRAGFFNQFQAEKFGNPCAGGTCQSFVFKCHQRIEPTPAEQAAGVDHKYVIGFTAVKVSDNTYTDVADIALLAHTNTGWHTGGYLGTPYGVNGAAYVTSCPTDAPIGFHTGW